MLADAFSATDGPHGVITLDPFRFFVRIRRERQHSPQAPGRLQRGPHKAAAVLPEQSKRAGRRNIKR